MKKQLKIVVIAFVITLGCFSSKLLAQNTIQSLEQCIELATANNLTLKSGRISIERAKDLQGTAFNIGKTNFAMSQDPTSGGSPDNSLSINQTFDFPTIYTSRKGVLKAETNLEYSRFEVSRNELIKDVTSTYYQLLYAKENIAILMEQDKIYSKFLFLANAKFKSGETNRLEQMNAERLYNENKIELQKAEKNLQNLQLLMQRWLNTQEVIEPAESSLPILETRYPIAEFDVYQTPVNKVYESQKQVSEKNLSLIKQGYLPSFNFSLKNQFLLKGFNPYDIQRERFANGNFMGFEVGVSVPLFFGEQRAKTKAAKREVEMARGQQEEVILTMRKGYETYMNEYYKAKTSLDYYKKTGNEQGEEIARISQIAYQKGEINYIEYIQNLKTAVEIHLQYANAVNDYNQTIIILNYLKGNN